MLSQRLFLIKFVPVVIFAVFPFIQFGTKPYNFYKTTWNEFGEDAVLSASQDPDVSPVQEQAVQTTQESVLTTERSIHAANTIKHAATVRIPSGSDSGTRQEEKEQRIIDNNSTTEHAAVPTTRQQERIAVGNNSTEHGAAATLSQKNAATTTAAATEAPPTLSTVAPPTLSTVQEDRQQPQRVLLTTFAFGNKSVAYRRFRMFVKSAEHSGVDYAIIGDSEPPFELPRNFKWVNVTWDTLVDRVYDKVYNGTVPKGKGIRYAAVRKVCDFKPTVGLLFPEIMEDYQWWGHCDNDGIIGNLTKMVPQEDLQTYDFISGIKQMYAWGPLMFYRNTKAVNELCLQMAQKQVNRLFFKDGYMGFDEWGSSPKSPYSMHALIKNVAIPDMGLKWSAVRGENLWDKKECLRWHNKQELPAKLRCGECIFRRGTAIRYRDGKEMAICHYHKSKRRQEPSLYNTTKFNDLLQLEEFRVAYVEGFDYIIEE